MLFYWLSFSCYFASWFYWFCSNWSFAWSTNFPRYSTLLYRFWSCFCFSWRLNSWNVRRIYLWFSSRSTSWFTPWFWCTSSCFWYRSWLPLFCYFDFFIISLIHILFLLLVLLRMLAAHYELFLFKFEFKNYGIVYLFLLH